MKTIPIFFTFNNDYVEPAAVAFYSLLDKAGPDIHYEMYVLHSDITQEKQCLLQSVVGKKSNGTLNFINTKGLLDDIWSQGGFSSKIAQSVFTADTIVRCFSSRFFPQYDKIIYSDVDIIVVDDISPLFDYDMGDNYILGVKNPFMKHAPYELSHLKPEHYEKLKDTYIAGGIWVMNLKQIREDGIEEKMMGVIEDKTIIKRWNDQDIVNIACMGRIGFIPLNYISYPYLPDYLRKGRFESHYSREELYDSVIRPKIIHYAAFKPWNSTPNFREHWQVVFDYLQLPKTRIFTDGADPKKLRREKRKKRVLIGALLFILYTAALCAILW